MEGMPPNAPTQPANPTLGEVNDPRLRDFNAVAPAFAASDDFEGQRPQPSSPGLGVKLGVPLACAAALLVLAVVTWLCIGRRRRQRRRATADQKHSSTRCDSQGQATAPVEEDGEPDASAHAQQVLSKVPASTDASDSSRGRRLTASVRHASMSAESAAGESAASVQEAALTLSSVRAKPLEPGSGAADAINAGAAPHERASMAMNPATVSSSGTFAKARDITTPLNTQLATLDAPEGQEQLLVALQHMAYAEPLQVFAGSCILTQEDAIQSGQSVVAFAQDERNPAYQYAIKCVCPRLCHVARLELLKLVCWKSRYGLGNPYLRWRPTCICRLL